MSFNIRTNKTKKKYLDVLIFKDEWEYLDKAEELKWDDDVKVDFSGTSVELAKQNDVLVEGCEIDFYLESKDWFRGRLVSFKPAPYIEVENLYGQRFGVLKINIKNLTPTFKQLSEKYIKQLASGRYRRYDIGIIKIGGLLTFKTAEDSMKHLSSKGEFVILLERTIK